MSNNGRRGTRLLLYYYGPVIYLISCKKKSHYECTKEKKKLLFLTISYDALSSSLIIWFRVLYNTESNCKLITSG